MGAHACKHGVTLPNDGSSVFHASSGLYEANRANWSFDYAWDLGGCTGCFVQRWVDVDAGAGVDFRQLALVNASASSHFESWNMEMSFIDGALYDFDPYSPSSTAFPLRLLAASELALARSGIRVDVPEPASMTLEGLGALGLGASLRRRRRGA